MSMPDKVTYSFFHQEPQKRHANSDTIMLIPDSGDRILVFIFGEDPRCSPRLEDLRNDLLRKLRVTLDGDKAA